MASSHAAIQRPTPNRQAAADVQIDVVEPRTMWVDRRYRARLERAGLTSFEAVMRSTGGRLLRALPHRENWRLDLADSRGTHGAYLKKHHTRYWWHWLRARLGMGPGSTAGRVEAVNIARLERDGIAVMRLVAFGERLHGDGLLESFLMTEELAGFTQLDHFLRERFPPRHGLRTTKRDAHFDALTRSVAQVAGAFHRAGYNHRDLYCCHFFIREAQPGAFEVRLIDLQRVEKKRLFRSRWLVKDLAQMAYSAPRDRVGCRQQLAFMRRYFGVTKLAPQHGTPPGNASMKIGLVIESFDPRRGGAEQWTWQLAAWLVRRDYEVHVVASRWSEFATELGVVCHEVKRSRSKSGFAAAASDAIARLRPDVVHDMGCGWSCDVLQPHFGSRAALERQSLPLAPAWLRPIKRHLAPWLPRYRDYRRLTRAQYNHKHRLFLAVSQMVADDLAADYGVDRSQIRVVHNGVDVERFSPAIRDEHRQRVRASLGVADDEVLVLIVAHNLRLKGVPTLVAAVERLSIAGRRVRLAVVGGKPRAAQVKAPGTGRQDHGEMPPRSAPLVHWLGAVDDPRPFYAAADVYVQPTLYDACSLVVLEAMACGLPVITTRTNGASELVGDGVAGYVLDEPQNIAALSDAIERLTERPLCVHMGQNARRAAVEHGTEANFRGVERIYAEVAAAKQAARRAA